MTYRFFATICLPAVLLSAPLRSQDLPRTADGHPDLQGIWTNATLTPLERPKSLAGKATLTDAEAAALEKHSAEELASVDGASEHPLLAAAGSNGTGGYNVLFIDRGSEFARVDGVKRTSLIVDPPSDSPWRLPKLARRRATVAVDSASSAGLGRR